MTEPQRYEAVDGYDTGKCDGCGGRGGLAIQFRFILVHYHPDCYARMLTTNYRIDEGVAKRHVEPLRKLYRAK